MKSAIAVWAFTLVTWFVADMFCFVVTPLSSIGANHWIPEAVLFFTVAQIMMKESFLNFVEVLAATLVLIPLITLFLGLPCWLMAYAETVFPSFILLGGAVAA